MEGLEGASDGDFDRQQMERTLAGLGKRRFLLHNVHEDEAVVFNTRWVLSYLAGPLTREQIKTLTRKAKAALAKAGKAVKRKRKADAAPALPPGVEQYFVPALMDAPVYYPRLLAAADLVCSNARHGVEAERAVVYTAEIEDGPVDVDWDNADAIDVAVDALLDEPVAGAKFTELPAAAGDARKYRSWGSAFKKWVRQNETVTLYRSTRFKLASEPGETEGEFRIRLQTAANEQRDIAVGKLRKRDAGKVTTLENRLMRAEQAIAREKDQSTKKKLDTAVSLGTAILGAVLGRKKLSSTTATKIGSAIKTAGGARKESQDVARAEETAARVREQLAALEQELADEVAALDTAYDAQTEELQEIVVRAKTTDIHLAVTALVWLPYAADAKGRLRPAWQNP